MSKYISFDPPQARLRQREPLHRYEWVETIDPMGKQHYIKFQREDTFCTADERTSDWQHQNFNNPASKRDPDSRIDLG